MNKTEAPVSDELTRQQYCLIIEELPVEYTDAVGENIDKLLKHDAALRAQLAACQQRLAEMGKLNDKLAEENRSASLQFSRCELIFQRVGILHQGDTELGLRQFFKKYQDLEAKVTALEQDNKRLDVENNQLWAVFKTCHGCKYVVPGVMFGCPIQHHIDLSGNCNQYEKAGE